MIRKLVIFGLMLLSGHLYASDPVTINVTGNIVASPCHIDESNMNQTINLGDDLQTADLNQPGSGTPWKDFSIKLTDCPAGTTSVSATFHGTPDPDEPVYYKNNGTAKNILIQFDTSGGAIALSDGYVLTYPVTEDGSVTFSLAVRGLSTKGSATPGTISSTITVDILYN